MCQPISHYANRVVSTWCSKSLLRHVLSGRSFYGTTMCTYIGSCSGVYVNAMTCMFVNRVYSEVTPVQCPRDRRNPNVSQGIKKKYRILIIFDFYNTHRPCPTYTIFPYCSSSFTSIGFTLSLWARASLDSICCLTYDTVPFASVSAAACFSVSPGANTGSSGSVWKC